MCVHVDCLLGKRFRFPNKAPILSSDEIQAIMRGLIKERDQFLADTVATRNIRNILRLQKT